MRSLSMVLVGLLAGCFISPDASLWQAARDGRPDQPADGPALERPLADGVAPEARADAEPGSDSPPGCDCRARSPSPRRCTWTR